MEKKPQQPKYELIDTENPIAPTYVALLLILAEGPDHAWHIKIVLNDRGFEEWVGDVPTGWTTVDSPPFSTITEAGVLTIPGSTDNEARTIYVFGRL